MDPSENEQKVWKNYRAKINEIMKHMEEIGRKNNVNPPDIRSQIQLAMQQCKQKKHHFKIHKPAQKVFRPVGKLPQAGKQIFCFQIERRRFTGLQPEHCLRTSWVPPTGSFLCQQSRSPDEEKEVRRVSSNDRKLPGP